MGLCASSAAVTARLPRPVPALGTRLERGQGTGTGTCTASTSTTWTRRRGLAAGPVWTGPWTDHAVCVVDDTGGVVERLTVKHTAAGLARLVTALHRHGVDGVAIERGDGPVVQALLDAELPVFVVASRQVTALRTRYGTAGNKDDRFDAYLLADVLRTDRRRLTALAVDCPETLGLRM